jgi:hypothetical protein
MRAAAAEANSSFLEHPPVVESDSQGLETPGSTARPRPLFEPTARTALADEEAGGAFHRQQPRLEYHSLLDAVRTLRTHRTRNEHAFCASPDRPP